MPETFQLSNKTLFSQGLGTRHNYLLGFWWFEELEPVICQSVPRFCDGALMSVPVRPLGLLDTQPQAAHVNVRRYHEYLESDRERWVVHVLLTHHQTFGKNWQKICGNLLQFEWRLWSLTGGCVMRWLAGPPPDHRPVITINLLTPGSRETEAEKREATANRRPASLEYIVFILQPKTF